jgi:hypothetical protein
MRAARGVLCKPRSQSPPLTLHGIHAKAGLALAREQELAAIAAERAGGDMAADIVFRSVRVERNLRPFQHINNSFVPWLTGGTSRFKILWLKPQNYNALQCRRSDEGPKRRSLGPCQPSPAFRSRLKLCRQLPRLADRTRMPQVRRASAGRPVKR